MKCSTKNCNNEQPHHTMFQVRESTQRICRSCFFGTAKIKRESSPTENEDLQMIEWFKSELGVMVCAK